MSYASGSIHAANLERVPEYSAQTACKDINHALHALAEAEHSQAFALKLASGGGSTAIAIVQARLSELLARNQDLRRALERVGRSAVSRDSMVDQCRRTGFRALVTAEKLISAVEEVLFGADDSRVAAGLTSGGSAREPGPAPSPQP